MLTLTGHNNILLFAPTLLAVMRCFDVEDDSVEGGSELR